MDEYGMAIGSAAIRSAGPIEFGPAGILFVADNAGARIFAVAVTDPGESAGSEAFDIADVDSRVGSFLGCKPDDLDIKDMAVHPVSHNVYLSVQRGRGDAGQAVVVRVDRLDGSVAEVPLEKVPLAVATISDAPAEDDGGADCIRLVGVAGPAEGAGVEVRPVLDDQAAPPAAATAGRLPATAGTLVRDGADVCFVPRFTFVSGRATRSPSEVSR